MQALAETVSKCQECPHLASTRTQTVFGTGNLDTNIMFVGEAPGENEDAEGKPFIGRAGKLLTKLINGMGYYRHEVYIANILKCRPDAVTGNRKPVRAEIENCLPYLYAQIEVVAPVVIVALGATAVEGLLDADETITSMRGKVHRFRDTPVVVTYHPAYVLRKPVADTFREWWTDAVLALHEAGIMADEEDVPNFVF